ncbi:hypothetical protein Cfor_03799 [Coptotermes formosanus]|uniref:RING-type E3 ubiquitin transferase n=1 Tax=Coptotermes formosanus TaxID=36987 RepID=A0A6L2Q138_COPFO|nr:hypothetical protein Cfor_03799 [Coptotermes formosanus]
MADNTGILSILECPVCFEYIVPPIYQCDNQHLLCSSCQNNQTRCPVCRVKLKGHRNLCMEKVSEYVLYPCKNEGSGCKAKLHLCEKQAHEWTCCVNNQYQCFGTVAEEDDSHCDWTGSREEIDDHIRETHRHLINNSADGTFNLSVSALVDYKYILFDNNLFCILIHTDPLRSSCIQKVFTTFFHILSVTCGGENCYAYSVKIEGQDDTFEGFVGRMITSDSNIKAMASRNECLHFMGNEHTFSFEGNIVKLQ